MSNQVDEAECLLRIGNFVLARIVPSTLKITGGWTEESWRAAGHYLSVNYYPGDGLWYAVAKWNENDPGIRCRNKNATKALRGLLMRIWGANGPLYGSN